MRGLRAISVILGLIVAATACSSTPAGTRGAGATGGAGGGGEATGGGTTAGGGGGAGGNVGLMGVGGGGACAGPIAFADPDVEMTIRDLIGVPSGAIRPVDTVGLTDLRGLLFPDVQPCGAGNPYDCPRPNPPLRDKWITSLAGIECLINVESIALDSWGVSDFTGLGRLPRLSYLQLGLAPDLSLLPALPQLAHLEMWSTLGGLSRLASFAELTTLSIFHVTDELAAASALAPLAGLTKLQSLAIGPNRLTDMGPLAGLTNLTFVDLKDNAISTLDPLVANAGIGAGDTVDLTNNPVSCTGQAQQIQTLRARGVDLVLNCP